MTAAVGYRHTIPVDGRYDMQHKRQPGISTFNTPARHSGELGLLHFTVNIKHIQITHRRLSVET